MSRPRQTFADHVEAFMRTATEHEIADTLKHIRLLARFRFPDIDWEGGRRRERKAEPEPEGQP